jgi:hypothetical protein
MTPITVRSSVLGRLAALVLIVLIVSPLTTPFSAISGGLEASRSGPVDSVKSETTQTDTIVEVAFVYTEPAWSVTASRARAPRAVVEFIRVNRVLRL